MSFDPNYDVIAAIDSLAPGVVLQREYWDGVWAVWAANGFAPLTQAQVLSVVGPLPPVLTAAKGNFVLAVQPTFKPVPPWLTDEDGNMLEDETGGVLFSSLT